MLVHPNEIVGKGLFDLVQFNQPERFREALSTKGGELPFSVYRGLGELRIATLHFYRTEHQGAAYVSVGWQELTDLYYLPSALDVIDAPPAVVGACSRSHDASGRLR